MRFVSKLVWPLTLAALVVGLLLWRPWRSAQTDPNANKYTTVALDRGNIVAKVTASGTLSALVTVQVGSQVSGRIKEIHADFNSPVSKGEVIARIDPRLFTAALEQARANFTAAKGDLVKAKVQAVDADRQLARARSLFDRKLIAQADYDTAQANSEIAHAQVAAAQGRVAQARAALNQAEVNLNYTTITSPIDGVVISRNVDVGQTVAASLQAPILFTIAEDLRKMQVDTSVAEADVGKLQPGMDALFTVDAYPNDRFRGKVRQIRNAPQTVQNVVTYDAVIDVQNRELKLRPGMTANVTFVYAKRNDALRTPNAALRFKPPGLDAQRNAAPNSEMARPTAQRKFEPDHRTVYVLRGDRPVPVAIKVGITDGSHTEIVEGDVREGDAVITDQAGSSATRQMPYRRIL